MMNKSLYLYIVAMMVAMMPWVTAAAPEDRPGEATSLQGVVRSDAEGWMQGVLVKAKAVGGTVTVTVVSDAQGHYRFPSNRLSSGTYNLSVRAAGYELSAPTQVEVVADKTMQQDLKLTQTSDLASQLMNAEWLLSVEMAGHKKNVAKLSGCVGCHSLTRVMTSKHDAKSWPDVLRRMETYGAGGQPLPYNLADHPNEKYSGQADKVDEELVKLLSEVNLSSGDKHAYELKTLPRPKGSATRVVVIEYDLPNAEFEPHEILIDDEGMVWSTDFVGPNLLRMNSMTGEFKAYEMPLIKPGFPTGNNGLEFDKDGNLWWGSLKQGGLYKFNKKTEEFTTWKQPTGDSPYSHSGIPIISPDGTVWGKDQYLPQIQQLHPDTGEFTVYDPFPENMTIIPAKDPQPQGMGFLGGSGLGPDYRELSRPHSLYGPAIDSKGAYYAADIGAGYIVKIEPDTKAVTLYQTPTPNSGPRRMQMDSQDRLWIGGYRSGKIGMFDTNTTEFKEWIVRVPYAGIYDIDSDKNGEVWSGGQHTDYLYRLNPKTGDVTNYLLPSVNMNIRNLGGVDNRTTPVTVWIGENHQNKIAKVEFLD